VDSEAVHPFHLRKVFIMDTANPGNSRESVTYTSVV
jgi:hypothetical protein